MTCPTCARCRVPLQNEFASAYGTYCESCLEEVCREEKNVKRAATTDTSWDRICPERYRDTVPERLPYVDRSARAFEWSPGQRLGLNLWGFPDTGKTRTMLLVLHNCLSRGFSVRLFETGQFAEACERHAYHTGTFAKALARVDILAFDDMDKLSLTRHQEMLFFSIVDRRASRGRPVLFTHNSTAQQLEYQFRCGESLVRRLRQFCQAIHFPART